MKSKLIALTLFVMALLLPADRTCEPLALQRDCDRQFDKCDGAAGQVIKLDLKGSRGVVCFIHKTHETYLNQDTGFPHRAEKGAECIGCHHKRSEATGVPIFYGSVLAVTEARGTQEIPKILTPMRCGESGLFTNSA